MGGLEPLPLGAVVTASPELWGHPPCPLLAFSSITHYRVVPSWLLEFKGVGSDWPLAV